MKRYYTKPMIEAEPMNMDRPLLAGSNDKGINATISGYQSSDDDHIDADDGDDFDGFSQDFGN